MTAHAKFEPATEIQPGLRVDRLLMLADHLERPETAEHFCMKHWVNDEYGRPSSEFSPVDEIMHCGTTACIAGHAASLFYEDGDTYIPFIAREALGLSYYQAKELFQPRDNARDIVLYTNLEAAATVRHLALTGEVKWDL